MLTIEAPAKINLTLEVLRKRPDGYHDISSVIQSIGLCDRLSFDIADGISFESDDPSWQTDKSLVTRAADLIKKESHSSCGAHIRITKRIPLSSGLGGDSSDGAAVLAGLNRLWNLKIPPGGLVRMASTLGSDMPFFLSGGTALMEGRGECVSPLPELLQAWIVLLVPPVSRPEFKTGALYALLGAKHFTPGARTDALVEHLTRGDPVDSGHLFNIFEQVAYEAFVGLRDYRDEFGGVAGGCVQLAGAGPTLYSFHNEKNKAEMVYRALQEKGFEVYLAQTRNSSMI
jgi:4-diphosphocytidyl-2-C-methyl-D-erythritol kinase